MLISAKFLKFEQLDQDPSFPPDATGASVDGTGQVGTYFYTAPEIEQGWPKIDEKVHACPHPFYFNFCFTPPPCMAYVLLLLHL